MAALAVDKSIAKPPMSQEPISEVLPPAELLKSDFQLIKAGVRCIDDVETIYEYIGYENAHQQRIPVIRLFKRRAEELRRSG